MPQATPQMRIALGTVELADTDRRAIAWDRAGHWDDSHPNKWIYDAKGHTRLADRRECRTYLLKHGESGVTQTTKAFLNSGGVTATMEGRTT